jgi:hypothetical protein
MTDVYRAMVMAPRPNPEPVAARGLRVTMFTRAGCPTCHGSGTAFDQNWDGGALRITASLCECVSFGHERAA